MPEGFGDIKSMNKLTQFTIELFAFIWECMHAFSPNLAINGDMGWICNSIRRKLNMIKMWNGLIKMDNTCLTKNVFLWGLICRGHNWKSEISSVLTDKDKDKALFYIGFKNNKH